MSLTRYYLPELAAGNFNLAPEEVQHIAGAKRQRVGDVFEVFDGEGRFARVRIVEIKSRKIVIEPIGEVNFVAQKSPCVEVAVAVPKGKRLQYMIEKLSELGVGRVVPVVCERSVAGGSDPVEKYKRWGVEACKQSRNLWVPEFLPPVKFGDYLSVNVGKMFMAEQSGQNPLCLFQHESWAEKVCLVIGPEGGFSEGEFEQADAAGVQRVNLSANILRIETAAVLFAGMVLALR